MSSLNSDKEEKFCMVYACGPAPYNGNAKMTYELVFGKRTAEIDETKENNIISDVDNAIASHKLMMREDIQDRINQIRSQVTVNATTLAPRLTEALLKIVDECSTLVPTDKWGHDLSPAALRSVAVNAASKLMEMYGIKEDIAHKVVLENADGDGITFNLIMPETKQDNEIEDLIK